MYVYIGTLTHISKYSMKYLRADAGESAGAVAMPCTTGTAAATVVLSNWCPT